MQGINHTLRCPMCKKKDRVGSKDHGKAWAGTGHCRLKAIQKLIRTQYECECQDCGHKWWSLHPQAERAWKHFGRK